MEAHVDPAEVLLTLFLAFAGAKVLAEVLERLGGPAVVGELAAGIVLGPSVLGWLEAEEFLLLLGEVGVIVLLFHVGLETHVSELRAVGGAAAAVAVLGVVLPFGMGYGVGAATGHTGIESAFVAAALVATSVGITAKVLADIGKLATRESRIVLGAAVIDDILGLLVLAVVVGLSGPGLDGGEIAVLLVEAFAFVGVLLIVAPRLMDRLSHLLEAPRIPRAPFAIAIVLLLGLSVVASRIELAAIVGAFLAGVTLAGTRDRYRLEHQIQPVADFLTPFFFVATGAQVDIDSFLEPGILGFAALITVVAIVGKLGGGMLGARGLGRRSALIVGVGMVPRGEVGIIVATLALSRGAIEADLFGAVLAMVVVTTLAAPPVLTALFAARDRARAAAGEPGPPPPAGPPPDDAGGVG